MKRRTQVMLAASLAILSAFLTLPFWGMGPAVFLDSNRTVLSRAISPDGARSAQVERIVVGGVPNIVVIVRSWWLPNWYLTGCVAAFHYEEAKAQIRWTSNNAVTVTHSGDQLDWDIGSAPFHNASCESVKVTFVNKR
jgi:hypothetical protein